MPSQNLSENSQIVLPYNYDTSLRSKESIEQAFLLLINTTQRSIDIYWINYTSQLILYSTIEPGGKVALNTFSTHPWIFRDKQTGLMMHVQNHEVFWPEPWILTKLTSRSEIFIHHPMQTLKTSALWTILMCLQSKYQIEQLELPKNLLNDLKRMYDEYINYQSKREN